MISLPGGCTLLIDRACVLEMIAGFKPSLTWVFERKEMQEIQQAVNETPDVRKRGKKNL